MATRQARSVPCPSSESPQGQTTPGEMTGGGAKAREQAGKRALDLGAVQLPEIRSKTLSPPSNVAWTDRGRLLEKKKKDPGGIDYKAAIIDRGGAKRRKELG